VSIPPASSPPAPPLTGPPGQQAPRRPGRREFGLALALGTLGGGVALLGAREPWARADFPPQNPLPGSAVAITGQDLAPAVAALAIAGLACLAAVIATRGLLRRITGALLAAFGAGISVVAARSTQTGHVAAVAAAHSPTPFGAGTAARAATAGVRPEIAMAAFPWWVIALAGGLLLVAAGVLTAGRGQRWPGMSSRYDSPAGTPGAARAGAPGSPAGSAAGSAVGSPAAAHISDPGDPAQAWEALDRGTDPTA
jgi:uncharacterized membrane protein (TIGR02234 family)